MKNINSYLKCPSLIRWADVDKEMFDSYVKDLDLNPEQINAFRKVFSIAVFSNQTQEMLNSARKTYEEKDSSGALVQLGWITPGQKRKDYSLHDALDLLEIYKKEGLPAEERYRKIAQKLSSPGKAPISLGAIKKLLFEHEKKLKKQKDLLDKGKEPKFYLLQIEHVSE